VDRAKQEPLVLEHDVRARPETVGPAGAANAGGDSHPIDRAERVQNGLAGRLRRGRDFHAQIVDRFEAARFDDVAPDLIGPQYDHVVGRHDRRLTRAAQQQFRRHGRDAAGFEDAADLVGRVSDVEQAAEMLD
jgi:hypothetical protein